MMEGVNTGISFIAFLIVWSGASEAFNLTILHTNDVHAHFVEFNEFGGACPQNLLNTNQCFGGFPRQVTKVKEIREAEENVVFLNGGDFYQGTIWFTVHRWQVVVDLVNELGIDVMTLGNHEFDDGLKGLYPFLQRVNTTVVTCNINASREPDFAKYVRPSTVLNVNGKKIGVIGYLTPETKTLSKPDETIEFEDEVECVRREAQRLTRELGLKEIIALGHSGFIVDQKIAREVPEVDIVVGGHTNTFLYTGKPPSVEKPRGPYPVVIEREDGSKCLVVQDFAHGKYMGYLQVQFNDEGKVISWGGNPILLNGSVPQDKETLEKLKPYHEQIKSKMGEVIGTTNVLLRGKREACRMNECNMGNFLADAALSYFVKNPTEKGWNHVAIAVWNSGNIRASIDERLNGGNITLEDVLQVSPFGNTMVIVPLKGKHLREVLEYSVQNYNAKNTDTPGILLQFSGLRLTFNASNPIGSRLTDVTARCADCRIPKYLPLEDAKVYEVVMNNYLAQGGDGFEHIQKYAFPHKDTNILELDVVKAYAAKMSPIIAGLEGRITILSNEDEQVVRNATETEVPAESKDESATTAKTFPRRLHSSSALTQTPNADTYSGQKSDCELLQGPRIPVLVATAVLTSIIWVWGS